MPDPQQDLAPIVPPVQPADDAAATGLPVLPTAAVAVLVLGLAYWWQRRAPLRALHRLLDAADPVGTAHRLAAWLRKQGVCLADASLQELDRLRFGKPVDDAQMRIARLLREAEDSLLRKW